jgi:hypothetical protein
VCNRNGKLDGRSKFLGVGSLLQSMVKIEGSGVEELLDFLVTKSKSKIAIAMPIKIDNIIAMKMISIFIII